MSAETTSFTTNEVKQRTRKCWIISGFSAGLIMVLLLGWLMPVGPPKIPASLTVKTNSTKGMLFIAVVTNQSSSTIALSTPTVQREDQNGLISAGLGDNWVKKNGDPAFRLEAGGEAVLSVASGEDFKRARVIGYLGCDAGKLRRAVRGVIRRVPGNWWPRSAVVWFSIHGYWGTNMELHVASPWVDNPAFKPVAGGPVYHWISASPTGQVDTIGPTPPRGTN
jgi:hypothetical protein